MAHGANPPEIDQHGKLASTPAIPAPCQQYAPERRVILLNRPGNCEDPKRRGGGKQAVRSASREKSWIVRLLLRRFLFGASVLSYLLNNLFARPQPAPLPVLIFYLFPLLATSTSRP